MSLVVSLSRKRLHGGKDTLLRTELTWPEDQMELFQLKDDEFSLTCHKVTATGKELTWIIENMRNVPYVTNAKKISWRGSMADFIFQNFDWKQ